MPTTQGPMVELEALHLKHSTQLSVHSRHSINEVANYMKENVAWNQ